MHQRDPGDLPPIQVMGACGAINETPTVVRPNVTWVGSKGLSDVSYLRAQGCTQTIVLSKPNE